MGLFTHAKRWQWPMLCQCLCQVMDHVWGQTEAAKWYRQLAVNYARLSLSDASGNLLEVKPELHMMQELLLNTCHTNLEKPSGVCEYMDEDFVVAVTELAARRGWGQHSQSQRPESDGQV